MKHNVMIYYPDSTITYLCPMYIRNPKYFQFFSVYGVEYPMLINLVLLYELR